MGDYWTNAVRHPEDVGVGHIRRTITFDTSGVGAGVGVPIGALEAGAIPLLAHVNVSAAFNAGTTNVLILGIPADDDGFAVAAGTIAGAAGFKPSLSGAETGKPLAANTIVYAKFTQTGAAATAGKAEVILTFVNKREHTGIPFPAN